MFSNHSLNHKATLTRFRFPLSEHIVDLVREVPPPAYLQLQPLKNLTQVFPDADVLNVDVLNEWPSNLPSQLDSSQMDALRRIIAKRLAIVHGPPGCGKTHVSVNAIQVLLENMTPEDPPILVAAHTNHALDQLLRHISAFEPDFIRLGGWTKDMDVIKPRTLYEIKSAVRFDSLPGSLRTPALAKLRRLAKEMIVLLGPLTEGEEPLSGALLYQYGIISDSQYESLVNGSKEWVRAGPEGNEVGEISIWLGDEQIEAKKRTLPEDFGIEFEEADLEFEQLKELEAESKLIDEEDHDTLRGSRIVFNEPFTGTKTIGVTEESVNDELKKQDLWTIPSECRGPVYRHMQRLVKEAIRTKFRDLAHQYAIASQDATIGRWELDYNFLKQARVIGMTTTGLSKYRGLLQALEPKVVVIEEAAETLEAPIAVACFQTLEHLVLVGDHQQLRAHCNDEELAGKPFYLGVSMFERLVRNEVEYTQLKRQRRMIPEIRRALAPIYDELEDHPSVLSRPPVPGMGGVNSYFFTHKWRETRDSQMSMTNSQEADFVVAFFYYLVQNGMHPYEITVLTFYNGQRKLILRKLREQRQLQETYFKVVTVDSYQGEENAVVLLSLVRSNDEGKIGFLNVENRICVAISRAQRGFYIFGDGPNLSSSSTLWWRVVQAMSKEPLRVGYHLPLTCKNHGLKTFIQQSYDFTGLDGGCAKPCRGQIDCGHICDLACHPFSHDQIACQKPCTRHLDCGHPCTQVCFADCKSDCECIATDDPTPAIPSITSSPGKKQVRDPTPLLKRQMPLRTASPDSQVLLPQRSRGTTHQKKASQLVDLSLPTDHQQSSASAASQTKMHNTHSFRDFAAGGHVDADKRLAESTEQEQIEARQKRLDEESFAALFGDPSAPVLTENKDKVNLVRTKEDGFGGSRGVWKGTFEVPRAEDSKSKSKNERSLLD